MRLEWPGLLLLSTLFSSRADTQKPFADLRPSVNESDAYVRNATDGLIFTTVASLLQQWPNTRYRNGHTIVKGTIPVGTILYHGGGEKDIPLEPEWLGFNVEHSYFLCDLPECWMLTMAVEEELNVVYFDGSSAANSYLGHQDSQDIVLWGRVRRDKVMEEQERIRGLCEWGKQFNLDAIVRMEPGFEVMLCDFTKKTKLVSALHIMGAGPVDSLRGSNSVGPLHERQKLRSRKNGATVRDSSPKPMPALDPRPLNRSEQPLPPQWEGPLRSRTSIWLEAVQAAAWNNFHPGEVRIRLDYTRLISFYDPTYTSLLSARKGVSRDSHRLTNISREDTEVALRQLQADLLRVDGTTSGTDWSTLTRTVTDRYANRLLLLNDTLANAQGINATAVASAARRHLMVMLTPYMIYGALPDPPLEVFRGGNTSWVEPIAFHCRSSLTGAIAVDALTRSEGVIKRAVDGVLNRICASLTGMWIDAFGVGSASEPQAGKLIVTWRRELMELMRWLGWPMWDICRPSCPDEMFCYISTWPWGIPWTEEDHQKIDMTARCIDRETGDLGPLHGLPHIT